MSIARSVAFPETSPLPAWRLWLGIAAVLVVAIGAMLVIRSTAIDPERASYCTSVMSHAHAAARDGKAGAYRAAALGEAIDKSIRSFLEATFRVGFPQNRVDETSDRVLSWSAKSGHVTGLIGWTGSVLTAAALVEVDSCFNEFR